MCLLSCDRFVVVEPRNSAYSRGNDRLDAANERVACSLYEMRLAVNYRPPHQARWSGQRKQLVAIEANLGRQTASECVSLSKRETENEAETIPLPPAGTVGSKTRRGWSQAGQATVIEIGRAHV